MFRPSVSSAVVSLAVGLLGLTTCAWADAQMIEVVIAKEADALEQFAAAELQRYLGRLFDASGLARP